MVDVRIILSGLWVALMLTYLLGDVLRIFAGDAVPGEMAGDDAAIDYHLDVNCPDVRLELPGE